MPPLRLPAGLRARAAAVSALATCAVAAVSVLTSYDDTRDTLAESRNRNRALTEQERERAPISSIPLTVEVLEYYDSFLRPDDRVYFHVLESGFGAGLDLRSVVTAAGRYWLLPAVEVEDVDDATVVVSWERDPAELGLRFSEQQRAGQQLFFVSRIER
jgi:hypothetical protein